MANSGLVNLVHDDDEFERDMKAAIAASLAVQGQAPASATNEQAPEVDEDEELRKVLALSMQTFEAEQQHRSEQQPVPGLPLQLQPRNSAEMLQLGVRKRVNGILASAIHGAAADPAGPADAGPHKRQRSNPSPASASNQVSHCGDTNPDNAEQDVSSKQQQSQPQQPTNQQQSQHMQAPQQPQQLPNQQQPVFCPVVGRQTHAAMAYLLLAISQSAGLQAAAVPGQQLPAAPIASPLAAPALLPQQQQQPQQQPQSMLVRGLGRSKAVPDLQDLATADSQQPQQQQVQQYEGQISAGDYMLDEDETGDWADNLSGMSSPAPAVSGPEASQWLGAAHPSTQHAAETGDAVQPGQQQLEQRRQGSSEPGPLQEQQQQQEEEQEILTLPPLTLADSGKRMMYQPRDPVYWIDPYTRMAFKGQIFGVEACHGRGHMGRRYVVDIDAAVRYVEADCEQLLPRIDIGEFVWVKPNMAHPAAWCDKTSQTESQQQQLQQTLARHPRGVGDSNWWVRSPWVQGCVVGAQVFNQAAPVIEVSLPCGGRCWFNVAGVQLVRETGESSTMAANKGQRPDAVGQQQQQQRVEDDDDVVLVGTASEVAAGGGGIGAAAADVADTGAAPPAPAPSPTSEQQQPQLQPGVHGASGVDTQMQPVNPAAQQQLQGEGEHPSQPIAAQPPAAEHRMQPHARQQQQQAAGFQQQQQHEQHLELQQQHLQTQQQMCSSRCGGLSSGCRCAGQTLLLQQQQQPARNQHDARNSSGVTAAAGTVQ